MWSIDVIRYENSVLHYFQARIYHVYTSLYALRGDVDSLFEYMRILATQELNPTITPPDVLKTILHNIENDIKSNARLKLCEDPNTNIWSYYGTIKLTPIVLQDYLMLILTVPLVDQTLYMNLYKVHNLPMLHPTLQMHETEPISLKLFNRAAADLDAKGEIQLRKYQKFLHKKNKNGDGR